MNKLEPFPASRPPTAQRPLLGLTVMVVEDSRFACEALRLLCLRSGARIRRADCLKSARRHLQVYRPTVVIVDVGLPDGSGADLIAELTQASPRVAVVLGTSGDDFAEQVAIAAGADGFLPKPVTSLATFQEIVLSRLPPERQPQGPRVLNEDVVSPDPIALKDDLAHVADVLDGNPDGPTLDYVAQFVGGVARSAGDKPLQSAAKALAAARAAGAGAGAQVAQVSGLVQERLMETAAI